MDAEQLNNLTIQQRRELYAHLSYEFSRGGSIALSDADRNFWNSVCAVAGRKIPMETFLRDNKRLSIDEVRAAAEILEEFINEGISVRLQQSHRMALRREVLGCFAPYLEVRGLPCTPSTIIKRMDRIGSVVNLSYPGYASSKLLHWIITPGT